ncbi:hypothetical protein [Streptosporangium sp. V21-05]|uniref:hypothetical protein n=1 Tax=Streptosporangium sp. V21-05 TaxID=3446115 RepID=UPI003F52C992
MASALGRRGSATSRPVGARRGEKPPAAYVTAKGDPADPAIDSSHSHGDGEVPAVTRLAPGHYRLTYAGIGKPGDSAQVSAITAGRYCHLGTVNSCSATPLLVLDVYCHSAAGTGADFGIAYLRAP